MKIRMLYWAIFNREKYQITKDFNRRCKSPEVQEALKEAAKIIIKAAGYEK